MGRKFDLLKSVWIEEKPKKKNKKLPEAIVKEQVISYLKLKKIYIRTIKSDGRKLPNGSWIPSSQGRGISDLIGILPDGRFLAIELKAEGKLKTATPEQLDFLMNIATNGGCAGVVDSVHSLEELLSSTPAQQIEKIKSLATLPKYQETDQILFEE